MLSYLASVWNCRYFWLALTHNDLRARYRGSILGMSWSLLNPLGMTVILCLVFSGLLNLEVRYFAPFLLTGLAFWTFFTTCATMGTATFFQSEAYIRQFPAPMAIYPLRTVLGAGFHASLSLLAAVGVAGYFIGIPDPMPLLSLIPTFALLLLFGWSVATLFGLATVFFRDTRHLTEVGLQGLFYLTPIMYPLDQFAHRARFLTVLKLNPLTSLLELIRLPLLHNEVPGSMAYLTAMTVVLTTLILASYSLARLERRLIFHL